MYNVELLRLSHLEKWIMSEERLKLTNSEGQKKEAYLEEKKQQQQKMIIKIKI